MIQRNPAPARMRDDEDFDAPAQPVAPAAPKPGVTFTISFAIDGFPITATVSGASAQLPAMVKQLKSLGATPPPAPKVGGGFGGGKPKVKPIFDGEGFACCPEHKRPLKKGQYGALCTYKDRDTGEWCKLKFEVVSDDQLAQ